MPLKPDFSAVSLLLILMPLSPQIARAQAHSGRNPVLVELFTSEGCSSCPPADRLLAQLQREQPVSTANIIVLEEHVDYWDRGGWHDRFSSAQFTERQNDYAPRLKFDDSYTPQMVVDGSTQFIGSDPAKALHAISQASQQPKIALTLSPLVVDGNHVNSSVTAASTSLPKGDVYAALVQPTASTEVRGGENGGRHLDHVSVVLAMRRVGKLQDLGSGLKFSLNAPSGVSLENLRVVVFAQDSNQGVIRGVATIAAK